MRSVMAAVLCLLCLGPAGARAAQRPWPIRVVIVVTYEIGKDRGDVPGEFQAWAERDNLTESLDFPGGVHPILTNPEHTILGVVSGTALVNAATSLMALGLDPRFDLTHAYWLINGTAGVDPRAASVGSAAWATYAVGDISRYIDPREAPAAWPYGNFAMGATQPDATPAPNPAINDRTYAYALNPGLADWAYARTKDVVLADTPEVAAFRADFIGEPNAQRPPFVLLGDTYAGDTFWHGTLMTRYAEDWVKLHTGGKGTFVMTDMEDSAFAEALTRLDHMQRADFRRVLILRTGSNFSMPRPGHTAVESLTAPYIGGRLAFENTWRVGEPIVRELVAHWDIYADHIPAGQAAGAPMPGVISQTKPAGPYTVTLNLLPAEAFLSPADAEKTHATEGMVVVGGAAPVPPDSATHPNHHLVAHIYRADGSAVQGAHPAITYARTGAAPVSVPIVEMQAAGMGAKSTHYGNNVTLAPGTYTVVVTVEPGAAATFTVMVP